MNVKIPAKLSSEAFAELKEITLDELGDGMSDKEIEDMGLRLLRLFSLVASKEEVPGLPVSDEESRVLKYLQDEIYAKGRRPTVRDVAAVLGKSSSRTGKLFLDGLVTRGLISRDQEGRILIQK